MVFKTSKEGFQNPTFGGQIIVSMIINFGLNLGFAWGASNNWGDYHNNYDQWNHFHMTQSEGSAAAIPLDLAMSTFFMSFFSVVFGTRGVQQEVRKNKCDVLDPRVLQRGFWRWTPVRIPGLCFRAFVTALYFLLCAYGPSILIFWAALGNTGSVYGLTYTIVKALWCSIVSTFITTIVYFSALDARNFPDMELDDLLAEVNGFADGENGTSGAAGSGGDFTSVTLGGGGAAGRKQAEEAPPLVGNVARA